MSERLFFALWPGEDQRQSLVRVQREMDVHRGRPVHALDIHITLVFLGGVTDDRRGCVELAAERSAGRPLGGPFELTLDCIGCFPRTRVLWCGVQICPPALSALVASLTRELESCGFCPDRRPYRPHATLFRKATPLRCRRLEVPIRWPVDGFALVETGKSGPPRYRVIRRWQLPVPGA